MVELELTLLNYTYYDSIDTNHTNNWKVSQNNLWPNLGVGTSF